MKFDDILRDIGEFGLYQKWIYFLTCIPVISVGCFALLNVIALGVPDHRCKIPGLENDTWNENSPEHESLVKYYIPSSDEYQHDRCHIYLYNNSGTKNNSALIYRSKVKCTEWVYDTSVFENTFVKQVNLVCDDAFLISHVQTIYYFGDLVGSLTLGQMSDTIGRKKALYISLMILLGSSVSLTFAPEFYSFVIIYFILGTASNSTLMASFVLGIENVGPSKRKWTGVIIGMVRDLGLLYIILMAYLLRDWKKIELWIGIPGIIYVFYICIIPESPRWLLSKDKREDAIQILIKMARCNGKELTTEMLASLEANKYEAKGKVWQLFSTNRLALRTLILFVNWFTVNMAFYGIILNVRNLGGDFFLNLLLLTVAGYPSKIISIALLDRLGRKKLYIGYMLLSGLACIGTVYPAIERGKSPRWLLVVLSVVGKMFLSGAFGVLYVFSSELFPTVIRNVGMGSSSACARTGSILSPYIVQLVGVMDGGMAGSIPLVVIGLATFLAGLLSIPLPETLNKTLPDTLEEADQFDRYKSQEITVAGSQKLRHEYTELK